MGLTANWPFVVMAIAIVGMVAFAIAYLFKSRAVKQAEVEVGVRGFTAKLKLGSGERQIHEKDFNLVNLNEFYADSDIGFVIHKPLSGGWAVKKPSLAETYGEKGLAAAAIEKLLEGLSNDIRNPNENIRVLVIRRGNAQSIRYTEETVIDGQQSDIETLEEVLPSCEEKTHDQLSVYAFKKDAFKRKQGLLDFFLSGAQLYGALGPKRLRVNLENTIFLIDCSAFAEKIEYNGELGDHVTNHMVLFQENNEYFFELVVTYVQAADKPTEVWDELRDYLNSFRVLVK
jgi:hypothetical protein